MRRGLRTIGRVLRAIGQEIAETIRFGAVRIDAAGYRQHDPDAVVAILGELRKDGDKEVPGRDGAGSD